MVHTTMKVNMNKDIVHPIHRSCLISPMSSAPNSLTKVWAALSLFLERISISTSPRATCYTFRKPDIYVMQCHTVDTKPKARSTRLI